MVWHFVCKQKLGMDVDRVDREMLKRICLNKNVQKILNGQIDQVFLDLPIILTSENYHTIIQSMFRDKIINMPRLVVATLVIDRIKNVNRDQEIDWLLHHVKSLTNE